MIEISDMPTHSARASVNAVVALWVAALVAASPGWSQITTITSTTGAGNLGTTVNTVGDTVRITGGTRPGNGTNLFHSFDQFSVGRADTAQFLNTTPSLPTSNILGRVTGGNPSHIFGTIDTMSYPGANLFLMNPAGFLFGPTATLNVGGTATFTSADYLRFSDNARFTAMPGPTDALLTTAPVAAFGFLGSNPGAITVEGSQLSVAPGQDIALVGGDITITSGVLEHGVTRQAARLSAPSGQVHLASLAGAGEQNMVLGPAGPAVDSLHASSVNAQGTIRLTGGTVVETNSTTGNAGPIFIRGGRLIMENSALDTSTAHGRAGSLPFSTSHGNVSVHAEHALLSDGSSINTSTSTKANAGDITFQVGTLRSNIGSDGLPLSAVAPVSITASSTGPGEAGTISIGGLTGGAADLVQLSNTEILASVGRTTMPTVSPPISVGEHVISANTALIPSVPQPRIEITGHHVELVNGTTITADTTGGADAGSITLNVDTLKTQAGPDGRVLLSSTSNCGPGCAGGQAGDITIRGIPGVSPTETRTYVFIVTAHNEPTEVFRYHMARAIDLQGTDLHSEAIGNAPGGMVILRTNGRASLTDSTVSVATQDFDINGSKPNGDFARNSGFSRIDIMAEDVILRDSTIKADAEISDLTACPTCKGEGPAAGEIWLRVQNSFDAENSSITNTSRGRAQAGITKIVKDHYFSYGAIWEPDFADHPTNSIRLTDSEISVEARHTGFPGYLRMRAEEIVLDHSILNSTVKDVSNGMELDGQVIDVPGAGERGRVIAHGRDVQGSILISAQDIHITGGGIVAPTQGSRIGSRIELHADHLSTQPGTGPGGTTGARRILNADDPSRVVISSSSMGSGGAGRISMGGVSAPRPEGSPLPPASSIRLVGTDVLTDTRIDALGGQIEMNATGRVHLHDTTISSNVNDVRPQSANTPDQGGNLALSAGSLSMQGSTISTLSSGSQNGGNIAIAVQESVTANGGSTISANNTGSGNAGNIEINAGRRFLAHNSTVTTEASHASGGNIAILATDMVRLVDSQVTASVQGGPGTTGGNIVIDPQFVILQNSQILAQAVQGQGGNIAITTGQFLPDATSTLSASSQFGVSGTVTVQSPTSNLAATWARLQQTYQEAAALLRQRCAAQIGGNQSSFVVSGRERIPTEPGHWLASPLLTDTTSALSEREGTMNLASDASSSSPEPATVPLRRMPPRAQFLTGLAMDWDAGCES